MHKQTVILGTKQGYTVELRADRTLHIAPKIKNTYHDADGIRMYRTEDGKNYIADVYDKIFRCQVKLPVLRRNKKITIGHPQTTLQ